ncbi:MAG: right-handed parallel beta-helix repeat-containing protein [Aristaeellaceae bacterium]
MRKLIWMALLLWLLPLAAGAETLRASPEGLSLTEALALCADGDVIELAEGVYTEPGEAFPLTVGRRVTIRAARGASPVIDAPAFKAALRVEAEGVVLQGLDIRFRRTGIYAIGSDMTVEDCSLSLADEGWRTSSCGMWCGGIERMTLRGCDFTGCGVSLAGPPLSGSSKGKPALTGLFEVGEEVAYFTSHTIENCTVNGKPLFYAVSQDAVTVPENAGQVICCDCDEVVARGVDVSDGSMGMVLVYNRHITLEGCRADRCGVFGIYAAKCDGGTLTGCMAEETNHGLDIRASRAMLLKECTAANCDQGMFFSMVEDSAMVDCHVSGTGQGYFMAAGRGNTLTGCVASACENGFSLQKEGPVLMSGCTAEGCTVCGVRLDATPTAFAHNTLRNNWVGVMAYGEASFDLVDNLFEDTGCCGLYLRDIGFSRISGNRFTGGEGCSVQAVGTLGGSVWVGNEVALPADFSGAADGFSLTD